MINLFDWLERKIAQKLLGLLFLSASSVVYPLEE
jgi:hypothetical protein